MATHFRSPHPHIATVLVLVVQGFSYIFSQFLIFSVVLITILLCFLLVNHFLLHYLYMHTKGCIVSHSHHKYLLSDCCVPCAVNSERELNAVPACADALLPGKSAVHLIITATEYSVGYSDGAGGEL